MLYFVYELYDPRTGITGYVGITKDPNQRYFQHIQGQDSEGEKKQTWVDSLLAEGVKPKFRILETVESRVEAGNQERYWIKYYKDQGIQLANTRLVDPVTAYYIPAADEQTVKDLADEIRATIKRKAYGIYGRMPSASEVAHERNLPYPAVLAVFQLLQKEGLIRKAGGAYRAIPQI